MRHLRWTERHKWCYTACNTRWVLWRRPQNPATTKLSQLRCGRDLGTAAGEPSVENTSPVALMCHRNVFSKESGGHTILTPGVNIVFRPPDSSPSFIAATDIAARRSAISWRQENDGGLCPPSGGTSRLRRLCRHRAVTIGADWFGASPNIMLTPGVNIIWRRGAYRRQLCPPSADTIVWRRRNSPTAWRRRVCIGRATTLVVAVSLKATPAGQCRRRQTHGPRDMRP